MSWIALYKIAEFARVVFLENITHCRKKICLNVWKLLSFIWPCLSLPSEEIGRITDGRNVTSQHTRVLPYKSINIYHSSIIKSISRQIIRYQSYKYYRQRNITSQHTWKLPHSYLHKCIKKLMLHILITGTTYKVQVNGSKE